MQKKQGISVEEAIKKLEYYCTYQDRCYKEVISKLKSLGMYQDAINHILQHLTEHQFLDESRFAKSFARGKHIYKFWGRKRIEMELKMRDISTYNIKNALKEIETDYQKHFFELAEKKWQSITADTLEKKKQKWIRYMQRKGYESSLIFEFINNYTD